MRTSNRQAEFHHIIGVLALALVIESILGVGRAQAICGDGGGCAGDCDGNGSVTVDEIVTMVNAALIGGDGGCHAGDIDASGSLTVDEIVTGVTKALGGCGGAAGVDESEECDDGGRCVGGADAGDPCTSEDTCEGNGACFGGLDNLRGCRNDDDCRQGMCRKCRPYGGDGCAANCTHETDQEYVLVPGQVGPSGENFIFGTSGAVVFGPILTVPLPLTGSQILTIGEIKNAQAPVALKASGVSLDRIPISNIACACVRGAAASTCGGTLFDADGIESPNCTPGFVGAVECPVDRKCAAVHGPGNTGSGSISCGGNAVDLDVSQDCNKAPGSPPFDAMLGVTEGAPTPVPFDDGAAYMVLTAAIGTVVGSCTGTTADYGADGEFCSDDDPTANRGTPNSIPFTTGAANGTVLDPGDTEDRIGPYGTMGAPFACSGETIFVGQANLAGAFTSCDQPTVSDIAVIINFVAQ